MSVGRRFGPQRLRHIVEQCVRQEMAPGTSLPADGEDLIDSGAVDSMAWVSVVRAVENATGNADFGERMMDGPRSMAAMLAALESTPAAATGIRSASDSEQGSVAAIAEGIACVAGWAEALPARRVAIGEVEREFKLAAGKIARGAGIESVTRVGRGEDEVTLGARAAEAALRRAGAGIGAVDCIIATSETRESYPSLAPALHAELLADERCGAMDVGGGCAGLLHALATARGMLLGGAARCVLIVTADVHSRVLTPRQVKGEFGALFGDGASAFVLRLIEDDLSFRAARGIPLRQSSTKEGSLDALGMTTSYSVGEVSLGCATGLANAIRLHRDARGKLDLHFQGTALARGAVGLLRETVERVAARAGLDHHAAAAFATHQPNPRLVETLARELEVSPEKFPAVARTCGNLGSSTCGVALARALEQASQLPASERGPIFVASLGPGILWGGTVLSLEFGIRNLES